MAYRQLEENIKEEPHSNPGPKPFKPIGREKELAAINKVLAHVATHPNPLHLWVWGMPGTGKTHCAAFAAQELAATRKALVAYSNCWRSNSLYALVNDIIDQFSILRAELQDTRFKLDRIQKYVKDKRCVFIIDEIDRLDAKERNAVLYQFHELKNFWIIAISHQEPQKLGIEPRVWSRLSPIQISFAPYTISEIILLLTHHLEKSDTPIRPSTPQLQEIASQSNGDARHAKNLLTQKLILGLSDVKPTSGREFKRRKYERSS